MKLRTDIKNEKRNNLLMILFSILFFAVATIASGQTEVLSRKTYFNSDLNKETTYLFPSGGLSFISEKNNMDSIYLSIMADSVGDGSYLVKLYAFLPKEFKVESVRNIAIEFTDNTVFVLDLSRIELTESYVEYELTQSIFEKMVSFKFNRIVFNETTQVFFKSERDYFISFFNAIAKK